MKTRPVSAAALLAAATLCLAPAAALAQDSGPSAEFHATILDLSAEGQVQTAPDLAVLQLGVQTTGPTAASAFSRNRDQMTATVQALKAQGVADRDIQTAGLSLDAQYVDDGKSPRRLTGYQASNSVSVRLHDLNRVGAVVDALVAAGANHVDGIGFALADPKAAQDQARLSAVKALTAKADLYAQAMGYKVARLVRLSEGGGFSPRPVMAMAAMSRFKATPVEPGELTVTADVSAVFELVR